MTPESAKLLKLMRNGLALINVVSFLMVAFMLVNGATDFGILFLVFAQFAAMYFVFKAIHKALKKYGQQQNHAAPKAGLEDHTP